MQISVQFYYKILDLYQYYHMSKKYLQHTDPTDPTAEDRKQDHITLAFESQTSANTLDKRFYYEPMITGHPSSHTDLNINFLGKELDIPLWISSMTGGTKMANTINHNLARACGEFKLGMGLGSCRSLLHSDDHLEDFKVRSLVGEQPLYANLGIAQVEDLIKDNQAKKVNILVDKLEADGLIVHVNPMQEWLQPEGDRYYTTPIDTIKKLRDTFKSKIIVKEVGCGFGPKSIESLLNLELDAIDFAANGGTNFSKIELSRADPQENEIFRPLTLIGHTAEEMVHMYNEIASNQHDTQIIISGGIKTFLDGYYLINKCNGICVYGQAAGFLKHSMGSYEELRTYVLRQIEGLKVASTFLRLRD